MSLAARVAVARSRRIAIAEIALPVSGAAVAATTVFARFDADPLVVAVTLAAIAIVGGVRLFAGPRQRRRELYALGLDARAAIDVAGDARLIEGTFRLAESTVHWPGFAMLALESVDDGRVLRIPALTADLAPRDRRALARFLGWALRARGGPASRDA